MNPTLEAMGFAFMGGMMYSIMLFYNDINIPKKSRNKKTNLFWLFFILWPFAGSLLILSYIRSGTLINGWPALTVGFTASTTFQSLMKNLSNNQTKNDENQTLQP